MTLDLELVGEDIINQTDVRCSWPTTSTSLRPLTLDVESLGEDFVNYTDVRCSWPPVLDGGDAGLGLFVVIRRTFSFLYLFFKIMFFSVCCVSFIVFVVIISGLSYLCIYFYYYKLDLNFRPKRRVDVMGSRLNRSRFYSMKKKIWTKKISFRQRKSEYVEFVQDWKEKEKEWIGEVARTNRKKKLRSDELKKKLRSDELKKKRQGDELKKNEKTKEINTEKDEFNKLVSLRRTYWNIIKSENEYYLLKKYSILEFLLSTINDLLAMRKSTNFSKNFRDDLRSERFEIERILAWRRWNNIKAKFCENFLELYFVNEFYFSVGDLTKLCDKLEKTEFDPENFRETIVNELVNNEYEYLYRSFVQDLFCDNDNHFVETHHVYLEGDLTFEDVSEIEIIENDGNGNCGAFCVSFGIFGNFEHTSLIRNLMFSQDWSNMRVLSSRSGVSIADVFNVGKMLKVNIGLLDFDKNKKYFLNCKRSDHEFWMILRKGHFCNIKVGNKDFMFDNDCTISSLTSIGFGKKVISCCCCCVDRGETVETSRYMSVKKHYYNDKKFVYQCGYKGSIFVIPSNKITNNEIVNRICYNCYNRHTERQVDEDNNEEMINFEGLGSSNFDGEMGKVKKYSLMNNRLLLQHMDGHQHGCLACFSKGGTFTPWIFDPTLSSSEKMGAGTKFVWKCQKGVHQSVFVSSRELDDQSLEVNRE